jgi:tRNA nucleotidyltransferase (CCA-adding enzyme)
VILPDFVKAVIAALETAGHEAYAVGGCVRDSLLGLTPADYDVTSSATPEEAKQALIHFTTHDTGIKHGTLTVVSDGMPVEVTTFRVDGEYSDNRRPDSVTFTRSLREDLSRRDFTINAMAYSESTGVVDLFGGREDLSDRLIRAVGEPHERFREDGLRILRALRFAAVYGCEIEPATAAAVHELSRLVVGLPGERIAQELNRLAVAPVSRIMDEFCDVFARFIPELAVCRGFDQCSVYHDRDVLTHTLCAADNAPPDRITRLALLFHDLGKPSAFRLREDGFGSFKGHAAISAEITRRVMRELKYDNDTRRKVVTLVRYHDITIAACDKAVKRLLHRFGEEAFFRLIDVHIADDSAKAPHVQERIPVFEEAARIARRIIAEQDCFSLKQLAVNGNDLTECGYQGREIGERLNQLLQAVINGECANNREELLGYM